MGTCLSRSINYSGSNDPRLLFELVPISSTTGFGGKPVYLDTTVPLSGRFDLDFGGFSQVEVQGVIVPDTCLGATFVSQEDPNGSVRVVEGTVPARDTMIPSFGRFGLAADEYHAEVDSRLEELNKDGIPHIVTFRAAIGSYDVYIEPRALSRCRPRTIRSAQRARSPRSSCCKSRSEPAPWPQVPDHDPEPGTARHPGAPSRPLTAWSGGTSTSSSPAEAA